MNGSATDWSKTNMTKDMLLDSIKRKSSGSRNSSAVEEVKKTTILTKPELIFKKTVPHASKSCSKMNESDRVTTRNKTNGVDKIGNGRRTKKQEKCESMEMSHVHMVYSQMAQHLHGIQHKAWPKVKQFLKGLQPGSIVADIGCGSGRYLHINKSLYKLGSDICIPLVHYAKEKGHEVMVADNLKLPYRSDVFDAVVSIGVIHHFSSHERRVQALRELTRVLYPGGRLLVCVWAFEQKHRRFESQDVLIPWHKHSKSALHRVRGSCSDFERSSTSSISDDDTSSIGSSLSIDSIHESSKSYNTQESIGCLLPSDGQNKSLVQECRRVEAGMKKLSLKPQDYQKGKSHPDGEVIHNGYTLRPETTSSIFSGLATKLKSLSIQTVHENVKPLTNGSAKECPSFQHSGKKYCKKQHEDFSYTAKHVKVQHSLEDFPEFDNCRTSGSAFNQVPAALPRHTKNSDTEHFCVHSSKMSSKLQSDKSIIKKNMKTGTLQKMKLKFENLFSSECHPKDHKHEVNHILDPNTVYCNPPHGFKVREFPQSSIGIVNTSLTDTHNVSSVSHITTEPKLPSQDFQLSSLINTPASDSCEEINSNGCFDTACVQSHSDYKSDVRDETVSVLKTQNSVLKDVEDDDVFTHASFLQNNLNKNGIQTNNELGLPPIFNDEIAQKKLGDSSGNQEMRNGDDVRDISLINSELSRYYHVFREGELTKLVSENIDDLIIIDTYFDHANWCLIAEKVGSI